MLWVEEVERKHYMQLDDGYIPSMPEELIRYRQSKNNAVLTIIATSKLDGSSSEAIWIATGRHFDDLAIAVNYLQKWQKYQQNFCSSFSSV